MLQKLTHAPNGSYCPHLVTPASPGLETSLMRLHLDKLTDSVDHLPLADCPGIQCTMWPTKMHKHGWDRSTSSIKFIGPIIFVHSLISQPSDLYESKWIQKKIRWTQVATTKIHAWLSLLQNEFCHALSTPAQWNPPRKSRKHIIIPVVIGCSAKAKALAACAWVNIRFKKFWPGQGSDSIFPQPMCGYWCWPSYSRCAASHTMQAQKLSTNILQRCTLLGSQGVAAWCW